MTRSDLAKVEKWVRASVIQHCQSYISNIIYDTKIDNYVDAYELNPGDVEILETARDQYIVSTTLMIMVYVKKSNDLYKLDKYIGTAFSCFTPSINIYKLGGEDSSHVGCLILNGTIATNRLGSNTNDKSVSQALLRADYEMEI